MDEEGFVTFEGEYDKAEKVPSYILLLLKIFLLYLAASGPETIKTAVQYILMD